MKAIGTIEITEELTLNNPFMDIVSVSYSWTGDNRVYFEIIFTEEGSASENSRRFEFINTGGGRMSGGDAWNMIASHSSLSAFNTQENETLIQKFINFFK